MLEINHLSYRVEGADGAVDILQDVSLTVEDKKFIVVTGPNGGGKTSLARAIMGINLPTGGSILWNGEDITARGSVEEIYPKIMADTVVGCNRLEVDRKC